MAAEKEVEKVGTAEAGDDSTSIEVVNASGHRQEVERNFSLLSICAVAVTTGNTWIAQGGSVVCYASLDTLYLRKSKATDSVLLDNCTEQWRTIRCDLRIV